MTISDANSAFLVDTYRGVAAALRGSGDCLLEYYLQAAEGMNTLRGSLVSINGSWGYTLRETAPTLRKSGLRQPPVRAAPS